MIVDEDSHALLDAGDGRRLERFGARLVDRPAPGALAPRFDRDAWAGAHLRFDPGRGWSGSPGAGPWTVVLAGVRLALRTAPDGGIGVFPEHAAHAAWLTSAVERRPGAEVLHLFGHTGLLTLVAAGAGGRVAHVDASRPALTAARTNAALSDLATRPIRWLVDDAREFTQREVRRGRRYDVVILDPPTWGHGPTGRAWRLDDELPTLLADVARLAAPDAAVLLTTHTPGWGADRLAAALELATRRGLPPGDAGPQRLVAESGAALELGAFARLGG